MDVKTPNYLASRQGISDEVRKLKPVIEEFARFKRSGDLAQATVPSGVYEDRDRLSVRLLELLRAMECYLEREPRARGDMEAICNNERTAQTLAKGPAPKDSDRTIRLCLDAITDVARCEPYEHDNPWTTSSVLVRRAMDDYFRYITENAQRRLCVGRDYAERLLKNWDEATATVLKDGDSVDFWLSLTTVQEALLRRGVEVVPHPMNDVMGWRFIPTPIPQHDQRTL